MSIVKGYVTCDTGIFNGLVKIQKKNWRQNILWVILSGADPGFTKWGPNQQWRRQELKFGAVAPLHFPPLAPFPSVPSHVLSRSSHPSVTFLPPCSIPSLSLPSLPSSSPPSPSLSLSLPVLPAAKRPLNSS